MFDFGKKISIFGMLGVPNSVSYAAAKHAVVGMTRTAALECKGRH